MHDEKQEIRNAMSSLTMSVREHKGAMERRIDNVEQRLDGFMQRLEQKVDTFMDDQRRYNEKRDRTLFGEKGDNGVVGDVGVLKTQQRSRDRLTNFFVLPTLVSLLVAGAIGLFSLLAG